MNGKMALWAACLALTVASCGEDKPQRSAKQGRGLIDDVMVIDGPSARTGPDRDQNGIRDDVDAYIAAETFSALERQAIVRVARTHQSVMVLSSSNRAIVELTASRMAADKECINERFAGTGRSTEAIIASIQNLTANTPPRKKADADYHLASNGVTALPLTPVCNYTR